MLRFKPANKKWWRKPLVLVGGKPMPAELAVLKSELRPGEVGVWLNSRRNITGVVELERLSSEIPSYRTKRVVLPAFVSSGLARIYKAAGVTNGCPDLVIWHSDQASFRLVEVKCPHWDSPSAAQQRFIDAASTYGITATIIEWEFSAEA